MKSLAILACLLATACAQQQAQRPTTDEINQSCGVGGKPFIETWPCVRVGLSGYNTYEDVKAVYVATGDYIVTQVQAGTMTDAEAKLAMAEARQRGNEVIGARIARDEDRETARKAAVLGAYMSRQQTQAAPAPYYMTPPALISTPRGTVTCQRTGQNSVFCS